MSLNEKFLNKNNDASRSSGNPCNNEGENYCQRDSSFFNECRSDENQTSNLYVKTEIFDPMNFCKIASEINSDTPNEENENLYCPNCRKIILKECLVSNGTDVEVSLKNIYCDCGQQLEESQNDLSLKKLRVFNCSVCGRKFKEKLFLIKHCLRVHDGCEQCINGCCKVLNCKKKSSVVDKKIPCTYCDKRYVRESDLIRHQLKKHVGESEEANIVMTIDHMDTEVLKSAEMEVDGCKIYYCKLCNKNIVTKRGYIRHVRIHTGERPFTCHICGKQFRSSADLTRHLRSVHDGIKNYSCDICGRCFANKGTRNDHRRTHTGERPYICNICGKAFPTANSIYVHRRIHTDYFPYQCTSCDKRFRRRQQLIHHVRTHTGEKPHACETCGKCFTVKDELSRHLYTHSVDKPFACSECGLCFGQKRYLSKHIRTQHNAVIDDIL